MIKKLAEAHEALISARDALIRARSQGISVAVELSCVERTLRILEETNGNTEDEH